MAKKCGDCEEKVTSYETCSECGAVVCDDCNLGHCCHADDAIEEHSEVLDAIEPGDGDSFHTDDCDDPGCRGECSDEPEDDDE